MEANVQARLRTVSHPLHVRINHHPLLSGLTGEGYLLTSYVTVLKAYFYLYQQMEMRIKQFTDNYPIPFDYQSRLKLPWLLEDIAFFEEEALSVTELNAHPVDFPRITSIGQLIGVLYPIEGSTLGGQVVSQHIEKNLGLTHNKGARFFSGYGDETPARWKDFCSFANTIHRQSNQCQSAQDFTLLTFQKFEEVLDDYHRGS
jgi:heme oxygenase